MLSPSTSSSPAREPAVDMVNNVSSVGHGPKRVDIINLLSQTWVDLATLSKFMLA